MHRDNTVNGPRTSRKARLAVTACGRSAAEQPCLHGLTAERAVTRWDKPGTGVDAKLAFYPASVAASSSTIYKIRDSASFR